MVATAPDMAVRRLPRHRAPEGSHMLRALRWAAWILVAVLGSAAVAATLGWFVVDGPAGRRAAVASPAALPAIGGPFQMRDAAGASVSERDLVGRPSVLFFGFTHCPDICPTTLGDIAAWRAALGPAGARLQIFFVTVDPERDSPEDLSAYVALFDPSIRALTGSAAELAAMAKAWRVQYRRVALSGGGYTMDHTATLYLVGADGRFAGAIDPQEREESALPKLRRLLGSGS